ncbi:hypothetical protein [Streptomyces xantholiticus]|uniref:hypothetical protein n=1 Tax=Streptomyces xantholiticus TaxID=68285 RepID=UPI00167364A1|nr:hypothetical protein [Streptomyces xantholiticus]
MQRGSNPKSPRKDDELKHQMQGRPKSGQHTHAEDAKDPEPVADDDPRTDSSRQARSRSRKSDDER